MQAKRKTMTSLLHHVRPFTFPAERLHRRSRIQADAFARQLDAEEPASASFSAPAGELERYFDGHLEGPGIWKWRHYFPIYERYFGPLRGKPVELMEIGIYSGGSLGMWRAYLGEECHVVGVDIEPACKAYAGKGVDVLVGDQADRGFWRKTLPALKPLHIVLDDGGHQAHQQIASFEEILPAMAPGGIYVCEDLHGRENGFAHYLTALSHHLNACRIRRTPNGTESDASGVAKWIDSIHFHPFVAVIVRTNAPAEQWQSEKHGTTWEPFLS